jgi:hypothetical protein
MAEDLNINPEHEPMIHEDFRSVMVSVCLQEKRLQGELSTFTGDFVLCF